MCNGRFMKPEMSGEFSFTDIGMFHVAYKRPPRSVFYHILVDTHFSSMSYLSSPNPYLQPFGRISQDAPGYRPNRWRYAYFSFRE